MMNAGESSGGDSFWSALGRGLERVPYPQIAIVLVLITLNFVLSGMSGDFNSDSYRLAAICALIVANLVGVWLLYWITVRMYFGPQHKATLSTAEASALIGQPDSADLYQNELDELELNRARNE